MFRFTIRELVLLTLVVATGVGWWIERRQLIAANRHLANCEDYRSRYEAALNQTVLAIYKQGFHWQSLNGQVTLRPLVPGDLAPVTDYLGKAATSIEGPDE